MGVGHARRRGHPGAPFAVNEAVGLAVRQHRKLHRGQGLSIRIAQIDALPGAAELEAGVQVLWILRAVVAGAVHHKIAVRRDLHRREAPLLQLVAGIGEVPALQVHLGIGGVVQLHVVVGLAVLIGAVDRIRAHGLADLHRAALHAHRSPFAAGLLGDFIPASGRGRAADLPCIVVIQAVDLVHAQLRRGHAVDDRALGVEQHHGIAAGGCETEGRAQRFAGGHRIGALGIDQQIFARRDGHVRKYEDLVDVGFHKQRILRQVDGFVADVLNLNPVRRISGIVEQRSAVLGHDFAQADGALNGQGRRRMLVEYRAALQQVAHDDGNHADQRDQHKPKRTRRLAPVQPERIPLRFSAAGFALWAALFLLGHGFPSIYV